MEKRYGDGTRPPAPAGMALGAVPSLAWDRSAITVEGARRGRPASTVAGSAAAGPASAAWSGRTPASCVCRICVERPLASSASRIRPSSVGARAAATMRGASPALRARVRRQSDFPFLSSLDPLPPQMHPRLAAMYGSETAVSNENGWQATEARRQAA
ncbi:unnamed protein product [Urochloa humidicola]